ncbi:MAG: TIGR04211 family SH3 domain-containing protein [Syntrophobacteraceae bacterium]
MHSFRPALVVAASVIALLAASPALATKAYTTDTQEIPLRLTPKNEGKTILMIPPASEVELVNPSAWVHVRYTKPTGELRDGWVQNKFLGARPPDSTAIRDLGVQNEALRQQLSVLDQEKSGLSQREKDLTEKLTKLNAAHEELKGGSANYLKLKSEYDSAKASLASAQDHIQSLIQENENLKISQRVQWFVAGALVLLTGLSLGWGIGRRQKKKKGAYYY